MNYLAHAFLSFNEPEIMVGNMISDFVKGKKKFEYPWQVQHGIALHRSIDEFTDSHPETKKAKEFFSPHYRLYSGAFVDVVYDHFLANDKNQFQDANELERFCKKVYETLKEHFDILPTRFQKMLPYMIKDDWLFNYRYPHGLAKSMEGLVHRSLYLEESETAFKIFDQHHMALESCYDDFFPKLKKFAAGQLRNLLAE